MTTEKEQKRQEAARLRYRDRMAARKEKKKARESNPQNIEKKISKKQAEINAMNGIKQETEQAKKVREKLAARSKGRQVGTSAENKKWEAKRKHRYDQRVWKGWRDREDTENPVKVLKNGDLLNDQEKELHE